MYHYSTTITLSILFLILTLTSNQSIEVDSHDLLGGAGLFVSSSLGTFTTDNTHTTTFISNNTTNILKLIKPSTSQISYMNGISHSFATAQPIHISFQFSSTSTQIQDTNLRLIDSNGSTLILFRAGKGGFVRVNENQMVTFYNSSVTTVDNEIKTMKVDLLLQWDLQTIQIFINNAYAGKCTFFNTGVTSVNQVLMYNLYQSTSYWKNLVICSQVCYNFVSGVRNNIFGILLMVLFMIILY